MLSTALLWALMGLLIVNILALRNPSHPVARCCGSLLMMALLLVASLPIPIVAMRPLLISVSVAVSIGLSWWLIRRTREPTLCRPRDLAIAVAVTVTSAILVAWRPNPIEYPADTVTYLINTQTWLLQNSGPTSCLHQAAQTFNYTSNCTMWRALSEASPTGPLQLLSGTPQRLAIAASISILGLSILRLLRTAQIGTTGSVVYWVLILTGLGNQSISFVINHALQGSILGAAVFVEAVMVMLAILQTPARRWQPVVLPLVLAPLLYLQLRLHGVFALLTLALLVPCAALVGLQALRAAPQRGLTGRAAGAGLLLMSLSLLVLILTFKTGWSVDLAKAGRRMIVPWSFLAGLGLTPEQLPASYFMRAPGSRPEWLAVVSLLASGWVLQRPSGNQQDGGYTQLAALFNVSIAVAYVLPPFSQLFLNLPYEVITLHRLMWGMILFSPIPSLLQHQLVAPTRAGWTRERCLSVIAAAITAVGVLVPIPGGSRHQPQLLWSKMRHLAQGPSSRVDLLRINQALLPSVLRLQQRNQRPPVVLADPIIGSALQAYPGSVIPIGPARITSQEEWENRSSVHVHLRKSKGIELEKALMQLKPAPDLIIQQTPIAPYYSPYAETRNYDLAIILSIANTGSNAIPASILRNHGFHLWQHLSASGQPVAANSPAAIYRLWLRTEPLDRR
jgi:hypothetical protein